MERRHSAVLLLAGLLTAAAAGTAAAQATPRTFAQAYPLLDAAGRAEAFSAEGLLESRDGGKAAFAPAGTGGLDPAAVLQARKPSFLVESVRVLPYGSSQADLRAVYHALSQVRALAGRTYRSSSRGKEIPLFEEAVRIEGPRKNVSLPDPAAPRSVPERETMYLRLKDANFGNSYYRADIQGAAQALRYALTNERALSYGIIPVMGEDKFAASLYVEPLAEGILVYGIAAAEVSSFVASRVNIPSAIRKRLEVIMDWLEDGLGL